jgi:hypothetical protein
MEFDLGVSRRAKRATVSVVADPNNFAGPAHPFSSVAQVVETKTGGSLPAMRLRPSFYAGALSRMRDGGQSGGVTAARRAAEQARRRAPAARAARPERQLTRTASGRCAALGAAVGRGAQIVTAHTAAAGVAALF